MLYLPQKRPGAVGSVRVLPAAQCAGHSDVHQRSSTFTLKLDVSYRSQK